MKGLFVTSAALLLLLALLSPSVAAVQAQEEDASVAQVMSDAYVLAELTESATPSKRSKSVSLKPAAAAASPKAKAASSAKSSASSSTSKPAARANALGDVAERLSEAKMREKYNRFLAKNKRRAAKLKTANDQQVSYAEFKKNRERIVKLNNKHGRVVYKSDGPFADMPKEKFQRRRLNTKNHRRRTRKEKKKVAADWRTNQAAIRARIKGGYPKTSTRASAQPAASSKSASSKPTAAAKPRKPSKSSKGALVEMESSQYPSKGTQSAFDAIKAYNDRVAAAQKTGNPMDVINAMKTRGGYSSSSYTPPPPSNLPPASAAKSVNVYTTITTYDQGSGAASNGGGAAGSAGMAPKRIAGIGSAGKSGKTGGYNDAGKSGKTGGYNDAGKSGKTGGIGDAGKSGKTGGTDADSAGKSGKTGGDPTLPNGVQVGSAPVSASTITRADCINHLVYSGVDAETADYLFKNLSPAGRQTGLTSGDERFTSYDTQGDCGSCWAHTASRAVAILRTRSSAVDNRDAALWQPSVQQLLECVHTDDTRGCEGGTPMDALDWMQYHVLAKMDNIEPVTKDDLYFGVPPTYPMADTVGECKLNVSDMNPSYSNGLRSGGWQMSIPECTQEPCHNQAAQEMALYDRLRSTSRVITYVDATNWQSYSGGIFPITDCSPTMNAGNHVVELVGIGTDPDTKIPVWIARNSWSIDWGEAGYIRLPFGVNACGLANFAIEANDWSHSYSNSNTNIDKPKEFSGPGRNLMAAGNAGVDMILATQAKYKK